MIYLKNMDTRTRSVLKIDRYLAGYFLGSLLQIGQQPSAQATKQPGT